MPWWETTQDADSFHPLLGSACCGARAGRHDAPGTAALQLPAPPRLHSHARLRQPAPVASHGASFASETWQKQLPTRNRPPVRRRNMARTSSASSSRTCRCPLTALLQTCALPVWKYRVCALHTAHVLCSANRSQAATSMSALLPLRSSISSSCPPSPTASPPSRPP